MLARCTKRNAPGSFDLGASRLLLTTGCNGTWEYYASLIGPLQSCKVSLVQPLAGSALKARKKKLDRLQKTAPLLTELLCQLLSLSIRHGSRFAQVSQSLELSLQHFYNPICNLTTGITLRYNRSYKLGTKSCRFFHGGHIC